MTNEIGTANASLVKALFDDKYNGQQIALLLDVNSRATSKIKNGEDYATVKKCSNYNIPDEIFHISKLDILNAIGSEKIREIYNYKRSRYGIRNSTKKDGTGSDYQLGREDDNIIFAAYGMVNALNETDYMGSGGDLFDPIFLKHKKNIE